MNTASPLEILAAVCNVLGILAAGWMLVLTKGRYDAVLRTGGTQGGPRILAAWRHLRCEGARIAYHVVTLGLGIWAMMLPNPTTAYGEASAWARFLLAALFTAMSVMDLMSDSRLAGMLGERLPGTRGPA